MQGDFFEEFSLTRRISNNYLKYIKINNCHFLRVLLVVILKIYFLERRPAKPFSQTG
jgi:hypothetical protein